MNGLEQVLVAVHDLRGGLLQRQQFVGPQVALVVGRGGSGQHGLC